jgi:hypothetical protein
MHSRIAALALAALLASCAHRQSKTESAPALAVEFPAGNGLFGEANDQLAVPPFGGVGTELTGDSLSPLPGTDPHAGPPITLSLGFTAHGDRVNATVYSVPPESDPLRWSDGHKRLLGRWSAKVNETIEIKELKKLGYEPITFRIVKAAPPPPYRAVISNVPSIKIAPAVQDGQMPYGACMVMLHNTSSSAVLAYASTNGVDPKAGAEVLRKSTGSPGRPAIAPRGDACDHYGDAIAAAVFSDGSYEGDPKIAAQLDADEIGQATVNRLLTPVIDGIVQDQSLDDDARTARIKEEIFRIQPGRPAMRSLRLRFPHAPAKDLAADLTQGFDFAKNSIWSNLYGYMHKCCQYPPPDRVSLAEWWRMRERAGI